MRLHLSMGDRHNKNLIYHPLIAKSHWAFSQPSVGAELPKKKGALGAPVGSLEDRHNLCGERGNCHHERRESAASGALVDPSD